MKTRLTSKNAISFYIPIGHSLQVTKMEKLRTLQSQMHLLPVDDADSLVQVHTVSSFDRILAAPTPNRRISGEKEVLK